MEKLKLKPAGFHLLMLAVAVLIGLLEYGLGGDSASLLLTLVFWAALIQGMVALVAVTELVRARWVTRLKRELLSGYPVLLLLAALLLLWLPRLDLYPWSQSPGAWLNPPFFAARNLGLLLASYLAAAAFARASLREDSRRGTFAIIYLLLFAASQGLVAFDLVMSLEYPWYSTLFGAFFMIEALYGAIALAAVIVALLGRRGIAADGEAARKILRDTGFLLLGFCVLWAGFFFAQYLLLWYGNLPEEVGFIASRLDDSRWLTLGVAFLAANFLIPFLALLSRQLKFNSRALAAVALVILVGLLLERAFYILPAVPVRLGVLAVENLLLAGLWLVALASRQRLLAGAAGESGEGRGIAEERDGGH